MFFALGKLKNSPTDKLRMVKLLLEESEDIDVGILNADKKACYEAYNDQFGFDEAASLVERRHLKGHDSRQKSSLFLQDFTSKQRESLFDKTVSDADKYKLIMGHILNQGAGADVNFDAEIREQLKQA